MSLFQRPAAPVTPTTPDQAHTRWGAVKLDKTWLSDAEQMNVYFEQEFKHLYPVTAQQLRALCEQGVIRDIEHARDFVFENMAYMDRFKNAADPRLEIMKLEQMLAKRRGCECDLPGHAPTTSA